MQRPGANRDSEPVRSWDFASTHWSIVLAACRDDSSHTCEALEKLCASYWYPLYAFVRSRGHNPHDAQDLTQAFFARLLEDQYLREVNPAKGKFRSFLLACLKHFLANEHDRAHAQKRGGGQVFVLIDEQTAESRYSLDLSHQETPERIFDRNWAVATLEGVLAELHEEYAGNGKGAHFEELKVFLTGDKAVPSYVESASRLGMTEGAVKVAVHRLRERYRETLKSRIARTVASGAEVEDEIRHLFAALSG